MNIRKSILRLSDGCLLAALSLAALFVSARVGLAPQNVEQGVAVIYAPWNDAGKTIARAVEPGARFVRFGGASFVAVVMPEHRDYVLRALDSGALFVVDPGILAACSALLFGTRGAA